MAERVGFEPTIQGYRIHTFQACAFDHSATAPSGCASSAAACGKQGVRVGVLANFSVSPIALRRNTAATRMSAMPLSTTGPLTWAGRGFPRGRSGGRMGG